MTKTPAQVTVRVVDLETNSSETVRAFPSAMPFSNVPSKPGKRFSAAVEVGGNAMHWVLISITEAGKVDVVGGDRVGDRGFDLTNIAQTDGQLFDGAAELAYGAGETHRIEVRVGGRATEKTERSVERKVERTVERRGPMSGDALMRMLADETPKPKKAPPKPTGMRGLMQRIGIRTQPKRIRPQIRAEAY